MGALASICAGGEDGGGRDALTQQIDADLAKEQALRALEYKVLLLGNAGAGKSTLLKHFKAHSPLSPQLQTDSHS